MIQASAIERVKRGADPCETFEKMAEQVTYAERFRQRTPLDFIRRNERKKMPCAFDLLFELCQNEGWNIS